MKAFLMSLAALVVISTVAAIALGFVPSSAQDSFSSSNVRL